MERIDELARGEHDEMSREAHPLHVHAGPSAYFDPQQGEGDRIAPSGVEHPVEEAVVGVVVVVDVAADPFGDRHHSTEGEVGVAFDSGSQVVEAGEIRVGVEAGMIEVGDDESGLGQPFRHGEVGDPASHEVEICAHHPSGYLPGAVGSADEC